ncbi:EAL domain-containing protein [Thioalkalivibrio sp. AKL17]|uniref:EAL domain-containing protein n=1 Tax=Thioalkalivibrio sp. AKL17 TaxID=1158160 RepID=UPI0003A0094A
MPAPTLVVAGFFVLAGCGGDTSRDDPTMLRVGLYENEPKIYTREDGRPAGLFPVLLEALAEREGWRLEYRDCQWAECLAQLEGGELDLMPDVALTGEREHRFRFHEIPVAQSWSQVYAPREASVRSLADLTDQRIAVLEGSVHEGWLTREMEPSGDGEPRLASRQSLDRVLEAVDAGAADVAVTNNFHGGRHAERSGLFETPVSSDHTGLYFAASPALDPAILEAVDRHLASWKGTPDSPYHRAMAETLTPEVRGVLPRWAAPVLASAGGLALLFGVLALVLRWQVRWRARELKRANRRFRHLLDSSPVVIYSLSSAGDPLHWVSGNLHPLFGYSPEEALRPGWWRECLHPEDRTLARRAREQAREQGHAVIEYRLYDARGRVRRVRDEMQWSPAPTRSGVGEIIGSWTDLTQSFEQREQLRLLSHYDSRTGLPNRTLLHDRIGHSIEMAMGQDESRRLIVLLDVDRFKGLNETLGTALADQVLLGVAQRLSQYAGPQDTVARSGADEFALLLERPPAGEAREQWLDGLLDVLREPFRLAGRSLRVTVSAGYAEFPVDGATTEELVTAAELALDEARRGGGNRREAYVSGLGERTSRRTLLESDLREALVREEFELFLQPQYGLDPFVLTGVEALVRWNHPERGRVSPGEFIPLAEETGLVMAIDQWVLDQACAHLAERDAQGLHVPRMAVNLSVMELEDGHLTRMVQSVLDRYGLQPHRLELEVTETMLMRTPENALAELGRLKELGVELAMDDFGTGYSNLALLHRMPLNRLKLDQSLVQDIGRSRSNEDIIRAILALARTLDLEVIGEGIETEAQRDFLLQVGCREGQGYLWSPPVPAEQCPCRD